MMGGQGALKTREAAHAANQKKIAIETARRQLIEQIQSTWKTYNSAKGNINFYADQVKANLVALDGTRQELRLGSKILLDVLNAQGRLVEAQLNLSKAESQLYQSAYQLEAFMGRLTCEEIKLGNYKKNNFLKTPLK